MTKAKTLDERLDAVRHLSETERHVLRLWPYVEEGAGEIMEFSDNTGDAWLREFKIHAMEIVNTELESLFEDVKDGLIRKIEDYNVG